MDKHYREYLLHSVLAMLCDVKVCNEEPQPTDFCPGTLQYMCCVTKSYKLKCSKTEGVVCISNQA